MERSSGWNMYVFRDGRRSIDGEFLLQGLRSALLALHHSSGTQGLVSALLWAGELECALADSGSSFLNNSETVTDSLADLLLGAGCHSSRELLRLTEAIRLDQQVPVSPPEGFAYYALHPLNYADLGHRHARPGDLAGIVGIRSIGTTLSAVVAAAFRKQGMRVYRATVRPQGHPYNRELELSPEQQAWVSRLNAESATFTVVDEGPGISGSSFLSVGEALVRHGVAPEKITFFGSRYIDPGQLTTPKALERYSRFRYFNAPHDTKLPQRGDTFIGAGKWRPTFLPNGTVWPGSWTSMERSKFITADGQTMLKFHGYGRFGQEVGNRLRAVAAAGFGPEYLGSEEGFGCTRMIAGRPATSDDLTPELLQRMAAYCAFRADRLGTDKASNDELTKAVAANWQVEFGSKMDPELQLDVVQPVIADAKMQPHEWIIGSESVLKIDSEGHGDDHFFPGPTDIAWDLAGAIIEWQMNSQQSQSFLREYQRLSGDDPTARMPSYLLAYATFRFAYCRMGAQALAGTDEEALLKRDYTFYRDRALVFASRALAPVA